MFPIKAGLLHNCQTNSRLFRYSIFVDELANSSTRPLITIHCSFLALRERSAKGAYMARPKTGKPPKKGLTLTITDRTRENLDFLSMHYNESISALVAEWAAKGAAVIKPHVDDQQPSVAVRVAYQKSTGAVYQNINISVSEQTREDLKMISAYACASISALVSAWAAKEAKAIRRKNSRPRPNNEEE